MSSKDRKKSFKSGIDTDVSRRRREEATVNIRKQKKEESISKRRVLTDANDEVDEISTTAVTKYGVQHIPELTHKMNSTSNEVLIEATKGFRKILSVEHNPPVAQVVAAGVVPYFVQFLLRDDCTELQFEAAWALTNIASTDNTHVVVEFGAVPHLVRLLLSTNPDIREQCAWCLGNVAGDSPEYRDLVLNNGALEPLLLNIKEPANITLLRNCTWTLSNFCRGKPLVDMRVCVLSVPVLATLLSKTTDESITTDACWALSYLSDGEDDRIQLVVDSGAVTSLVRTLSVNSLSVTPALRAVGNVVTGNDGQTQLVIENNVYSCILPLLNHQKKGIRKETAWLLSNIAAGTQEQIGSLVGIRDIMVRVVDMCMNDEWDVRKECAWVISNIITGGSERHTQIAVDDGVLSPLVGLLAVADTKITLLTLEAIEKILAVSFVHNLGYENIMFELGAVDLIEKLQEHANDSVYQKSVRILEKYFGGEDEIDTNVKVANGQFVFGGEKLPSTFNFGC